MADVRSMLRAERAQRRITHPHASYSSSGKLSCNLCNTLVKSEAHWQSHLHSTQHQAPSRRTLDAAAALESTAGGARKRKVSLVESPEREDRKKAKPDSAEVEDGAEDGGDRVSRERTPVADTPSKTPPMSTAAVAPTNGTPSALSALPSGPDPSPDDVDEAELAAFERDLAALEREQHAPSVPSALTATATISAAPLTADEIAAQAREEQSTQRGKRDVELEDEREDAARALEDEMAEMAGLEERVRKLRERREALRKTSFGTGSAGDSANVAEHGNGVVRNGGNDDEGEDSDEEDIDDWRFGGS